MALCIDTPDTCKKIVLQMFQNPTFLFCNNRRTSVLKMSKKFVLFTLLGVRNVGYILDGYKDHRR